MIIDFRKGSSLQRKMRNMKNRPTRSTFLYRLNYFTDQIRKDIHSGVLAPGTYLPAETELADQYQLSKASIRKGLAELVEEGLIEKIPRVGNRVIGVEMVEKQILRFACHQSLIREAAIEPLIQCFEKENPDIQIQFIPIAYQQYIESIDHYIDNHLIDILSINYDQYIEFVESDRLHLFEPQEFDSYMYPFVQNGFVHGNTLYAKPFIFSPVILCYNRKHFLEKQLPEPDSFWSWQTLKETAHHLSNQEERYGFYFHLLSQNRWPVFLLQNGYHYDETNQLHQAELFLESMTLCKDLITGQRVDTLLIADHDLYAEQLFMKEKASIIMTTYFNLNYVLDSGIPFEIAPLPYMKEPRTLLLTLGLSVLKTSTKKEAAQRFVDYLTKYESQLYIRQHSMSIPAHQLAAEWAGTGEIYQPNRFFMYREIIPSFRYYNELGMTPQQLMSLRSELSYFWSGLSDGADLLQALKKIKKSGRREN